MDVNEQEQLLYMLKALADESRLALLRRLNGREQTVGDLAEQVKLSDPTVSHHLARLRTAGLVTLRTAGNQRFYRANESGLARFKRLAADIEQLLIEHPAPVSDDRWIETLGWSAEDQQVLRDYTANKRLTDIPSKRKKLLIVLRWLATMFEGDTLYSEAEVNTIIKAVHADCATLRRELVDFGYLRRERGGGKYWVTPSDDSLTAGESTGT